MGGRFALRARGPLLLLAAALVSALLVLAVGESDPTPAADTAPAAPAPPPFADVGTTSAITTTLATTTIVPQPPEYQVSFSPVTADDLPYSWRPGCPLDPEELTAVGVTHWEREDGVETGTLVVASELAEQVAAIFEDLFAAGFPIERMSPIDVYAASDEESMAANNTSAFNCRPVSGGSSWSEHAYGRAIDIGPLLNPYVRGDTVLPPEGARYADRSLEEPGMIHPGDDVVEAFSSRGWVWGGTWRSPKDYQHFSTTGR